MKLTQPENEQVSHNLSWAIAIFAFLTGMPVFLVLGTGWPGPQSLPKWSELSVALNTGAVPTAYIIKILACILWVVWLQMGTSVSIDVWAHARGRVSPRTILIPRFMRQISNHVVTGALLASFSLQNPVTKAVDNMDLLQPVATAATGSEENSSRANTSPKSSAIVKSTETTSETEHTTPIIHTVIPQDNLQAIAAQYLGSPDRWTEVFLLNEGQSQLGGGSLYDPAQLEPGWELIMPVDAKVPVESQSDTHAPITNTSNTDTSNAPITVKAGDSLWKLAEAHLGTSEKWLEIYNANRQVINDPNTIQPGWELFLPRPQHPSTATLHPAEPPADPQPSKIPEAVLAYTKATPTVTAKITQPIAAQNPLNQQTLLAIGGLGLFASSFVWLLAKLRQTKPKNLPDDRKPQANKALFNETEKQLWAHCENEFAELLNESWHYLANQLNDNPPPNIAAIKLHSNGMTLLLDAPATPPNGIAASKNQLCWEIPKQPQIHQHSQEIAYTAEFVPTLVSLGKINQDEFLLNLTHVKTLCLTGHQQSSAGFCNAIATQLASSHLTSELNVICIGFGKDLFEFEKVSYAPDVAKGLELITRQRRETQALLGTSKLSHTNHIETNHETTPTTVVITTNSITAQESSTLIENCNGWACLIAQNLPKANTKINFTGKTMFIEPFRLWISPHSMSVDSTAAISALVTAAKLDAHQSAEALPVTTDQNQQPNKEPAIPQQVIPQIEILMIGPVAITGTEGTITSQRVLDIIAFLAAHPEGCDRNQLIANLWPSNKPPSRSTFSNSLSKARQSLGTNPQGEQYLPRMDASGIYRLHPEIRTDLQLFHKLRTTSRLHKGEEGKKLLIQALELVRGTPFTGGNGKQYRWADFGLRNEVEYWIDETAHELAKRCLATSDPEGVKAAVLTSLRIVGLCEECYRWRLKAACKNPAEVRRVMAELIATLNRENNETGVQHQPHTDTQAIYNQIMAGKTFF